MLLIDVLSQLHKTCSVVYFFTVIRFQNLPHAQFNSVTVDSIKDLFVNCYQILALGSI